MQAVIFDCDGVLVNSEDLIEEAQQETYAHYGFNFSMDEIRAMFSGLSYDDNIARCAEVFTKAGQAQPNDFRARLHDIFNAKAATRLAAIDGIPELLTALRNAGIPFCVASNSGMKGLQNKLRLTGLHGFFDPHIFSREQVARGKPHPDVFLLAADVRGKFDPKHCIVVEDTPTGAQAGIAAGMTVIGFARHGGAQADALRAVGVAHVVADGKALKDKVFALLGRGLGPVPPVGPSPA